MIDLVSKVEERERGQAVLSSELGIPEGAGGPGPSGSRGEGMLPGRGKSPAGEIRGQLL